MIVSITHRSDFDGIASGALIVRYAALHKKSPFLVYLKDYGDKENVIEEGLFKLTNCKLYIADLSTSFKHFNEVVKRIRRLRCGEIYWFDHHPTSNENLNKLKELGVKLDIRPGFSSSAIIVYENLYSKSGIEDEIARKIADYADDIDSWRLSMPLSRDIMDLVAYYKYLDEANPLHPHLKSYLLYLSGLKDQNLVREQHKAHIEIYRKLKDRARDVISRTVEVFEIDGINYAICYAPCYISSSQAAEFVLDSVKAQVAIVVKEEGTGSVRRRGDVDVSKIARLFEGGGHPYAAGMRLKEGKIDLVEYPKFVELIKNKLRELHL